MRANLRDLVGPFTTSCEVRDAVNGPNLIVSIRHRNWPNSNINVSFMKGRPNYVLYCHMVLGKYFPSKHVGIGADADAQVHVILTGPNQFYLHKIFSKELD